MTTGMTQIDYTEMRERFATRTKYDPGNHDSEKLYMTRLDLAYFRAIGRDCVGVEFSYSIMRQSNFNGADAQYSAFQFCDLRRADFTNANLHNASFSNADLSEVSFYKADLTGVNFHNARLTGVNLSGAVGLPTATQFIEKLEKTATGVICYKAIGNTSYGAPEHWDCRHGAYLTEVVNPDRCTPCGSGVNVANSLRWCNESYPKAAYIWKCQIDWIDLADVVVPYNTDGKFRASRVKLLEPLMCCNVMLTD